MDHIIDLGPHSAFIVIAYAVACAIVGLLVLWVIADHRRQLRTLRQLEAEGITRRSARRDERA